MRLFKEIKDSFESGRERARKEAEVNREKKKTGRGTEKYKKINIS